MAKSKEQPFRSAIELATLAEYTGDLKDLRASIEAQLKARGIDVALATDDLPRGKARERELIVRLISLARGHGLYVTLGPKRASGVSIKLLSPKDAGQLQSSH